MVTIIRRAPPAKNRDFPRRNGCSAPLATPGYQGNLRTAQCFAAPFFGMKPIAKLTAMAPQKSQNSMALGEWKSTL